MKPLVIECPRRLVNQFTRAAKRAFPRETYGILIGLDERHGPHRGTITVTEIYIPDDVDKFCGPGTVKRQRRWFMAATEQAQGGAEVIGEIHSHPWTYREWSSLHGVPGRQLSESDHDSMVWDKIAGVCRVYETSTGHLRSSVRFWPPTVPLETILKRK